MICLFSSCRQITLFEEWILLKDFEKREDSLANRVLTKVKEKDEIEDKVLKYPLIFI